MIELRAPKNFSTNAFGAFALADGYVLRPNRAGWYAVDDAHQYVVSNLVAQGWQLRTEIEAQQREDRTAQKQLESREQQARALPLAGIFELIQEQHGVELEVRDGRLFVKGKLPPTLGFILGMRRQEIITSLINGGQAWKEI